MLSAAHKPLWRLTQTQLGQWIAELLRASQRVIAPVDRNGRRVFAAIASAEEAQLGPGNPRQSPKEFIFPRTETLFVYRQQGDTVQLSDPPLDEQEQVLFGLHPCDAAGLVRLDSVLGSDPFYAWRREHTTVVAQACASLEPACFCTAVGGSPVSEEGADILIAAQDDFWIVRVITDQGDRLVRQVCTSWEQAFEGDFSRVIRQGQQAAERAQRTAIPESAALILEKRFENEAWERTAQRCIGCSICTYVCPSCSCFDLADEGNASAGKRCRNWDSCSFALFTLHGSGHNPRPTQAARFRQRVLHKFAYFPLRYGGAAMCVGCGRCIEHCPVGIDIHHQVVTVLQSTQESSDADR